MSEMSEFEGNAKPQTIKRFQKKYWKCNYHLEDKSEFDHYFEVIERIFAPLCETYAFGEEYGNSGNTPHIEGYMIFYKITEFHIIQELFQWSFLEWSTKKKALAGLNYSFKEKNKVVHNMKNRPEPLVKMEYCFLRPDQQAIVDMFRTPEDPLWGRNIYWFWEPHGRWGKSVVATHMIDFMDAFMVSGKGADIKCGLCEVIKNTGSCPPIVIIDVPRSNSGFISYQAIEEIKNGCMFNGKYESGMCRFNKPHIIIFSNTVPDDNKLSEDRWIIKRVDGLESHPNGYLEVSSENEEEFPLGDF